MAYLRAVKPNYALDSANVFGLLVGAPALASVNRLRASLNMKVGAYAVQNGGVSADGLPRNVTVTQTAAGNEDTNGTVLVTGLNADGAVITESLIPNAGATVAGAKAFASVTSIVGAGWVIDQGNDTITFGFGDLIGLPSRIWHRPGPVAAASQLLMALLGGAVVAAPAFTFDSDEIEKNTLDASASVYDSTKKLYVLIAR